MANDDSPCERRFSARAKKKIETHHLVSYRHAKKLREEIPLGTPVEF
jgi:hypothetical protein